MGWDIWNVRYSPLDAGLSLRGISLGLFLELVLPASKWKLGPTPWLVSIKSVKAAVQPGAHMCAQAVPSTIVPSLSGLGNRFSLFLLSRNDFSSPGGLYLRGTWFCTHVIAESSLPELASPE